MFKEMLFRIHENAITMLTHVRLQQVEQPAEGEDPQMEDAPAYDGDGGQGTEDPEFYGQDESSDLEGAAGPETAGEDAPSQPVPDAASSAETDRAASGGQEPRSFDLRHKTDPAASAVADSESEDRRFYNGVKVGRNDPCPCGSGKKFKKCCGRNL